MRVLLDADVVIFLWKAGAGALLEDVARVYPLAMSVMVHDEIMRGHDSWLVSFERDWERLVAVGAATELDWVMGDDTQAKFRQLVTKYEPRIADITAPFSNRGDLANLAWLITTPDLVYVTEDRGAKYRGFIEVPGVPTRLTQPCSLLHSVYEHLTRIESASLERLRRWSTQKKGSQNYPVWWPDWLSSLSAAPP